MARDRLLASVLSRRAPPRGGRLAQQFGDAEVEQLDPALRVDKDVARLDVAMDDQLRVGVLDRVAHLEQELEPPRLRELELVADAIDPAPSLDVLHDQEGHALFVRSAVQQARDVRVL